MNDNTPIGTFLVLVIVLFIAIIILVILQFYRANQWANIQRHMRRLRRPVQPWVTVLVYAHNNEDSIVSVVHSLVKNRYYNFDIVVVDDISSDTTSSLVRAYMAQHSTANISLLRRRKKGSCFEALQAGYRKSRRGEVVISMAATAAVPVHVLKQTVAMRGSEKKWKVRVPATYSTKTLLDIIRSMRSVLFGQSTIITAGASPRALFYSRRSVWRYSVLVMFLGILAISFMRNNFIVLWYSWAMATVYLLAAIWLSEQPSVAIKRQLTFSVPTAFFLLPVASIVEGFSQLFTRK